MRDGADVVIVGAGFAGLACARSAAAGGLDALVLERKSDPGLGLRTTGILVHEVASAWALPRDLLREIHGVRLYAPSLRSLDLDLPGYSFFATDTPALLRWLADEATSAGARLRCGAAFDGEVPSCRWLVGADGARSRVARRFGLGVNRELLLGAEVEYAGVRGVDEDRLHCFLDSDLARGYLGWVVPGVGVTQVGLACRPPAVPRVGAFVERVSRLFDFGRARIVGRRAGPIPVGGPVHPIGRDPVLLIGDAAGLVSPLTAGGIHTALRWGDRAGEAIAEAVLRGGPDPVGVLESEVPRFRWKGLLRAAMDLGVPNRLLDAVLGHRWFRALARTVFFHHQGLLTRRAWVDVAGTLAAM